MTGPTNQQLTDDKIMDDCRADEEWRTIRDHFSTKQLFVEAFAAVAMIDSDSELLGIIQRYDYDRFEEMKKEALA